MLYYNSVYSNDLFNLQVPIKYNIFFAVCQGPSDNITLDMQRKKSYIKSSVQIFDSVPVMALDTNTKGLYIRV